MLLNGILGCVSLQAPPNKTPQVSVSRPTHSNPTIHFLEVVSISDRDPVAPSSEREVWLSISFSS